MFLYILQLCPYMQWIFKEKSLPWFAGEKEDVINVVQQFLDEIYTPEFLQQKDPENNSSMANKKELTVSIIIVKTLGKEWNIYNAYVPF